MWYNKLTSEMADIHRYDQKYVSVTLKRGNTIEKNKEIGVVYLNLE